MPTLGASQPRPIRVLLADDHEVVRIGLKSLLAAVADLEVAGEAGTVAETLAQVDTLRPDIVVLDVRLPDGSGVDACRRIHDDHPGTRVVILTSYSDSEALFAAITAGAAAYMLKQAGGRQLIEAIRIVHAGGSLLDPTLTDEVLRRLRGAQPEDGSPQQALTTLERRMLDLLALGRTNMEIGTAVHLSETAVKHHVSDILRKLHVRRRSEAAAVWARRHDGERDGGGATPGVSAPT